MSKLTAVEWLIEQVNHKGVVYNNYHIITDIPKEIIEQAKAMDRQRLIDFARYCETEWNASEISIDVIDAYLESN
jgi:hypothetical protein